MQFLAVSTQPSPGLDRYLASAQRFGVEPRLLGMGTSFLGHGTKFMLAREALRDLPPQELVVATDCWDVIFLRDPSDIEKEFKQFDSGLVYAAERGFKYAAINRFRKFKQYPTPAATPGPYRFLNGGAWIGYAGYALDIFSRIPMKERDCDQTILNQWFIENPQTLKLDYRQQIFASTIWREGFEHRDFERNPAGLHHREMGTYPFFMHFGGENAISSRRVLSLIDFPLPSVPPRRGYREEFLIRAATNRFTNAFALTPYPYVYAAELGAKVLAALMLAGLVGYMTMKLVSI